MKQNKNKEKYLRIIAAATRVFARRGFYQARVLEIAGEAGVADGTIYLYFENKDDILISLFEEQMKVVLLNMKEQVAAAEDPAEKIERFALCHLKLIEQNKDMAEIIQVELRQSSKFMKSYKNDQFAEYLELIADIIRKGQEEGLFKKNLIPDLAKRALFGALDELSRYWVLSTRRKYDIETAAKQISETFLYGLVDNPGITPAELKGKRERRLR
jgi:TetR/AcrR family transcriptional regulator, fatty acid metabolism regulator protein